MTKEESNSDKQYSREDIALYAAPWVSGTRAQRYNGTLTVMLEPTCGDFDTNLNMLLDILIDKAVIAEVNAVVGVEIVIDPFYGKFGKYSASGTAALLEPLF